MSGEPAWIEVQVDRLVGPTHHFGGLGVGNIASQMHRGQPSNPAAAALQGLDKMRRVATLGAAQWILPPQPRPDLDFLRRLGFGGSDRDLLRRVREESPMLLSAAMSGSAMWTANAATILPACDGSRGATSVSVANLVASLHRSIEPAQTLSELRQTLPASFDYFPPLPGGAAMRDEGAANHMRLASDSGPGIHLFVYGDGISQPQNYWPRQSLAAFQAIARQHRLDPELTFFVKQHPRAIDAGAFHNDVVAMSDHDLLIHHELAFDDQSDALAGLEDRFRIRTGKILNRIVVDESSLSLDEAISTYLFNSQILLLPRVTPHGDSASSRPLSAGESRHRAILCPIEVANNPKSLRLVEQWQQAGWFAQVHFVDLGQSMDGGGGPACLRLRIPVREEELSRFCKRRRWSESLDVALREAIQATYPTHVTIDDMAQLDFVEQAVLARNQVAQILSPDRAG